MIGAHLVATAIVAAVVIGLPQDAAAEEPTVPLRAPGGAAAPPAIAALTPPLAVLAAHDSTVAGVQRRTRRRHWVQRHPVWTGALVGCAIGTAAAAARWGAEGSFVGFWGGAGAGAAVGWMLSR